MSGDVFPVVHVAMVTTVSIGIVTGQSYAPGSEGEGRGCDKDPRPRYTGGGGEENDLLHVKTLANEVTLLRTHCCRHKSFPVRPRAQHFLRTKFCVRDTKNTNFSQFAQPKKHHGQQCVRNNVSSFSRAFRTLGKPLWKQGT